MPARARIAFLTAGLVTLAAAAWLPRAAAAVAAANTAPASVPAAQLIESLGLRIAPHPVRERSGWRAPRIILVSNRLHELLPRLQQAAPHAKLIELGAASARQIADADATIGVCSAEVLGAAQHLQ
ncbi:MAG: hypothetical protein ACRETS_10275, partial [Steroidobacteraceae bacterium]